MLHLVGVYLMLYPGSSNEVSGFFFSFKQDSDIPRKSKFKFYSVISVLQSEIEVYKEIFKRNKKKCLFMLLNRAVISFGS